MFDNIKVAHLISEKLTTCEIHITCMLEVGQTLSVSVREEWGMIDVVDKELIRRLYYVEGKSIRWIHRELGYARQTIRKALRDAAPPEYRLSRPRPQPVTGTIRSVLAQWVAEDEAKPHKKQRHTGQRMYERLVEEYGYTGSPSSIQHLVAELRRQTRETLCR